MGEWKFALTVHADSQQWQLLHAGQSDVVPRVGAALGCTSDGRLLLLGGESSTDLLQDCWTMDLLACDSDGPRRWLPLLADGVVLPAARDVCLSVLDRQVVLYGGQTHSGDSDALFSFVLPPREST